MWWPGGYGWIATSSGLTLDFEIHVHRQDTVEGRADMTREHELTRAFVEMADTLVADYDVVELLQRLAEHCVDLFDVTAAGLLLADEHNTLRVLAASTEQTRMLELFQLQNDQGPCLDCFRTGEPISVPDLTAATTRWPIFASHSLGQGFVSVHALPLRLRETVIGALNLFDDRTGALLADQLDVAQALADVATIGILHERAIRHTETLAEQLQHALNSRVTIEQAKGVLAAHHNCSMDDAFTRLRTHARVNNLQLTNLARRIATGQQVTLLDA